jgi:hypothetical protein
MTQAEYDAEWLMCQQEAIDAGALEPQSFAQGTAGVATLLRTLQGPLGSALLSADMDAPSGASMPIFESEGWANWAVASGLCPGVPGNGFGAERHCTSSN